MSSVDLDEDLKSDVIYDDNQRLIKDDLGNKFEYEVVDDDYSTNSIKSAITSTLYKKDESVYDAW